jgi:hypothetical protein
MLKIKIHEIHRHRNETTFRPWLECKDLFREVGMDFIFEGNKFDMEWVGQASYMNKNKHVATSVSWGKYYLEKYVKGDYVLFDGQDSATLMGNSTDMLKIGRGLGLKKNSFYKDRSNYYKNSPHGRIYWERDNMIDWSLPANFDFEKVQLSGCNWLSTLNPNWFRYKGAKKDIDVFALFSFPANENYEFNRKTSYYYDHHRMKCYNFLQNLPKNIKVETLKDGQKIPIEQYYALMSRSKIVVAPFGYGEMAPRDMESAMVGSILVKPDMGHLETIPNIYLPNETYIPVKWDFSDMNQKIEATLERFDELQEFYVENMRNEYVKQYAKENLVTYTYNWIKNLEGYGTT